MALESIVRNRSDIERVAQSVALVLPLTAVFAAVPAYADSIPIDISFSAPVAPQPFTNPKDFSNCLQELGMYR